MKYICSLILQPLSDWLLKNNLNKDTLEYLENISNITPDILKKYIESISNTSVKIKEYTNTSLEELYKTPIKQDLNFNNNSTYSKISSDSYNFNFYTNSYTGYTVTLDEKEYVIYFTQHILASNLLSY